MSPDTTRLLAGVLLAILVPIAAFVLDRSVPIVALSAVCVGLVVASLYTMFGPSEAAEEHAA